MGVPGMLEAEHRLRAARQRAATQDVMAAAITMRDPSPNRQYASVLVDLGHDDVAGVVARERVELGPHG
jgi:hypothetical protein